MRDNGNFPAEAVSTVTETIYRRIRQEILDGAFKPGAKLKLDTLKARYHVSVNTLRETLSRLVADGLVQNEGQRGFTVVPASLADLRDITEVRRMSRGAFSGTWRRARCMVTRLSHITTSPTRQRCA